MRSLWLSAAPKPLPRVPSPVTLLSAWHAGALRRAGANRDARSASDRHRVHGRTLNTGHTLSQIQLSLTRRAELDQRRTRRLRRNRRWRCARAGPTVFQKRLQLSDGDGPTFQKCWSFGPPIIHAIIAIDSSRPPAWQAHRTHPYPHTPVPPNPAVEPLPASLLYSIFCYE